MIPKDIAPNLSLKLTSILLWRLSAIYRVMWMPTTVRLSGDSKPRRSGHGLSLIYSRKPQLWPPVLPLT
jgi:hypothetical protein